MKQHITTLFTVALVFFFSTVAQSQELAPAGGGTQEAAHQQDNISEENRAALITMLKQSEAKLLATGKLKSHSTARVAATTAFTTKFQLPLRQKAGLNDPGFYGISNFVDQNTSIGGILDYNCGNRTYDVGGVNHKGTDFFIYPFAWDKMNNNAVEVIAAAAGTIIMKLDGLADKNCALCTSQCSSNSVYIKHADGSVAWYFHMKKGSLTSKAVGSTVSVGEYLGVVGSSGSSTSPHVHLEVYTNSNYTTLVDPWTGPCNSLNSTSWWASQRPYYEPQPLKAMTHSAAPAISMCPGKEVVNQKTAFRPGSFMVTGAYFRDEQPNTTAQFRLIQPNNAVWQTWSKTFTTYANADWWYWNWTLPSAPQLGTWRFEITYAGKTISTNFTVSGTASKNSVAMASADEPIGLTLAPNPSSKTVTITGQAITSSSVLQLINSAGVPVLTQKVTSAEAGTVTLNISSLSSGLYYVLVTDQHAVTGRAKLMKE